MHNQETLKRLISDLEMEHRDLDNVIEQITKELPFDQLQVQRLKKRKLSLKDQLILLKSRIIPDTIA